jgi:hypothetical protein
MAWHDELDNDVRASVVSKGWDRLEGDKAAVAIFKSYRELERTRPEAPPKDASAYTFDGVRNPDGSLPDQEIFTLAREMATELKLPVAQANLLASRLINVEIAKEKAASDKATLDATNATDRLNAAWGADKDRKVDVASKAFQAMGLDKTVVDALVSTLGVDKVMQTGYDLGTKMGEATLLKGNTSVDGQKTSWTREEAIAERNRLVADTEFGKKLLAGESDAKKKFDDVTRAILGDPAGQWSAPPDNFGRRGDGQGREIQPGHEKWSNG